MAADHCDKSLDLTIYVERITELYSGMHLLAVGGLGTPNENLKRIDVRYDGQPATFALPIVVNDDERPRLHFSTQLPVEKAARRVQVIAVGHDSETTVFDESVDSIPYQRNQVTAEANGGCVARAIRSVVSGEILSPTRWKARIGRFALLALRVRQKLQYKLLLRQFRPCDPHQTYAENTAVTPPLRKLMAAEVRRFQYRPKISILLPVWNSNPKWLAEAVASVRDQVYDRWELCISDDASTDPRHLRALKRLPKDSRIKIHRRSVNGHICANMNSAADVATGDFVAFLDHDDKLSPDALYEIVRLLQDDPSADVIYSDEDKLDEGARRYDPQFKPDWSPELLLSYNYINHFTCIRRSVFEKAGRFRVGYHGSQDHDLLLRTTEVTGRVRHIPRILYHWRSHPESTASTAGQKNYVHLSGRRAVEDALSRRGIDAKPYVPPFAERLGLPVLGLDGADRGPTVAVLVHGDGAGATARAVRETTDYQDMTIHVVASGDRCRAAAGRSEDLLLFLEAGVVPVNSRWLSRLVAHIKLPGVGAVGGLIRDESGAVVNAGTLLGMRDGIAPDDAFRGLPRGDISYYFYAEVTRNVTAPGWGCLLTKTEVFRRVGGFGGSRTLFDVDYALRLAEIGLRSVHVGGAELQATSARSCDPVDLLSFRQCHGRLNDPYSNPNFSERDSFRPTCDGPPSLLAASGAPAPRALVAAHNLNSPEGAPRYLSEIVLGLAGRGRIEPTVFSPLGGAGEAAYHAAGVPVTVANESWSRRFVDGRWEPRDYDAAQKYLAWFIDTCRPGVAVCNTLLTFPVVEAATRAGVPAVWIIHESYSPEVLSRVFPHFARSRIELAFATAARVIPASHDTAKLFAHWNTRGNVRVLHNGLDPSPFETYRRQFARPEPASRQPDGTSQKRVIAVGTVCERKGQHTLVEAAAELAKTRRDFACYLVGMRAGVPYANYVRELVRRYRLEGLVHLIDETDDVRPYFHTADIFVCTSHIETFSRAILEAEAFGLPIVSTPCCGVSEQVLWGHNALKFDFGDSKGLAANLNRLLSDDETRAGMAERSQALFYAHLSDEEMLDRYDHVIRAAARPTSVASRSRPWNRLGIRGGHANRVGR